MFLIKEPGGHTSREEDSSAIPSDEHRDLCIKLYKDRKRSYEKQDHKKFNKTRLRKWGMPAIIEEVETDHNLVRGVLKASVTSARDSNHQARCPNVVSLLFSHRQWKKIY